MSACHISDWQILGFILFGMVLDMLLRWGTQYDA